MLACIYAFIGFTEVIVERMKRLTETEAFWKKFTVLSFGFLQTALVLKVLY